MGAVVYETVSWQFFITIYISYIIETRGNGLPTTPEAATAAGYPSALSGGAGKMFYPRANRGLPRIDVQLVLRLCDGVDQQLHHGVALRSCHAADLVQLLLRALLGVTLQLLRAASVGCLVLAELLLLAPPILVDFLQRVQLGLLEPLLAVPACGGHDLVRLLLGL